MKLETVPLSAFNLIEGAAFQLGGNSQVFIVTKILYRHSGAERIGVLVRVLDEWVPSHVAAKEKVGKYNTFSFDFCDVIHLVGLCVNPDSWDDLDIGQTNSMVFDELTTP